ncbi:MAG: hypothetical protein WKF97_09355 [Chitinophagaceae bacterium]
MQELINRLKQRARLNDEQAVSAIEVIKDYTKEIFPMFADAIDKLFDDDAADDKEDFMG